MSDKKLKTPARQDKICGRNYTIVEPIPHHPPKAFYYGPKVKEGKDKGNKPQLERKTFQNKPKARYIVDGIKHPGGELPIRFKSILKAEKYIKNFALEVSPGNEAVQAQA